MTYFQAFILGLIQGLTEFLPVSSSGHTLLAGKLLGVSVPLSYELILHVATLISVLIFYRKSVWKRLKNPLCKGNLYLLLASIVTAVIALMLRFTLGGALSQVRLLPIFFCLTAGVLVLGSAFNKQGKPFNAKSSAIIGLVQGLACLPGISRSGSTISAALMLGIKKEEATEFSFLLSLPVILGSCAVEIVAAPLSGISPLVLAVGFTAALISGLLALRVVSWLMKRASLDVFAPYLIALSLVLVAFGVR